MIIKGLISASNGMQALINQNDSTANNVANVNTVGFKKQSLVFKDIYDSNVIQKTKTGDMETVGALSVGSQVQKMTYDFSQGTITQTGSPFDLAIQGDGFFKIQSAKDAKDVSYTRNGSFTLNNNGFLVTKDGDYVLDNVNKRIQIQTNGVSMKSMDDIIIGNDGQIGINVNQNPMTLQQIGVFDFGQKENMVNIGGSKFKPTNTTMNPEVKPKNFTIQQGSLEMSNANVVNEMIQTISTSRNYETLSKMVKEDGDSLERAIEVGRLQ